ncbi:MAG: hypothetical protein C5S41_01270 [Candidatus Methanomarinus sp.]|nr:MAG: hypothetical protein C5S41_01270 [ANME-2 cluster archaeon]
MNIKRVIIATAIGLLTGLFCAYGTVMLSDKGELDFVLTTGILASIVYNRILIGFVIGIADNIEIHTILRGAIIGAVISMGMGIMSLIDGDVIGGLTIIGFGVVYGIIADVVATKFS